MNFNLNRYYNSKTRIFCHIAFWGCFLAAHTFFYGRSTGAYAEEFFWALRHLPFKMAVTYFVLYFVIPRYLLTKKYIKALLAFVASTAVAALIQQSINYALIFPLFNPEWERAYLFVTSKMFNVFLGMYPVVTIAAFIKLVKYWYQKENQAQELKQQKLEAELKFLKAQIHPHFLFNTLNNLYALTLKKSESSSEVVLKLSDLLNYMLYEGNERTVPLTGELDLIEIYISLEKIRYGDRLDLSYTINGNPDGREIPPMLLLPFVENSFKHGASQELEQVEVSIDIEVEENRFTLRVKNDKSDIPQEADKMGYKEGIGLKNVKRRLELLYGDGHHLDISDTGERFQVVLKLQLDKILKSEES